MGVEEQGGKGPSRLAERHSAAAPLDRERETGSGFGLEPVWPGPARWGSGKTRRAPWRGQLSTAVSRSSRGILMPTAVVMEAAVSQVWTRPGPQNAAELMPTNSQLGRMPCNLGTETPPPPGLCASASIIGPSGYGPLIVHLTPIPDWFSRFPLALDDVTISLSGAVFCQIAERHIPS